MWVKPNQPNEGEFIRLAGFSTSVEAGLVQELLSNNGIQAVLQGENFGGLDPLPMRGGFSEIQLLVPAAELDRAQQLYTAFFEGEAESLPEDEEIPHE